MNHAKLQRVFRRILDERARQDLLKEQGRFLYTCADTELSHVDCAVVLVEEVGEVCRAVLNVKGLAFDEPKRGETTAKIGQLQRELIQVAAVACAWLESMEGEGLERPSGLSQEPTEGIQL